MILLGFTSSSGLPPVETGPPRAAALTDLATILTLLVFAVVAIVLWAVRERRFAKGAAVAATLQELVEEIAAAHTAAEIGGALARYAGRFPGIASLRLLTPPAEDNGLASAADPPNGAEPLPQDHPAVKHFREWNRAAQAEDVPPLLTAAAPGGSPAYYVPVRGAGRLLGMLEIVPAPGTSLPRATGQHGALHLARVAGAVLASIEESALREHVARSRANADAGGAVERALMRAGERLRRLRDELEKARGQGHGPAAEEVIRALADQIEAALGELDELKRSVHGDAGAVDVNLEAVTGAVLARRRREWLNEGVRVEADGLTAAVVRAPAQRLETLLETLLEHAVRAAAAAGKDLVTLSARNTGGHVAVTIRCPGAPSPDLLDDAGLRATAESFGGKLRALSGPDREMSIELRIPAAVPPRPDSSAQSPEARLTVLVADADGVARRHLLHTLARRGHRAVPADFPEAADLAARFPFDCALCTPRDNPERWEPFLRRIASEVGSVAVLAGPDGLSGRKLSGIQLLPRPLRDADLDEFLARVQPRESLRES